MRPAAPSATFAAFALFLVSAAAPLAALQGFPAYVSLPQSVLLYDEGSLTVENLAEAEFPLAEGKSVAKQGKHYRSYLKFGPDELNRPAALTWKEWQPALLAGGWKLEGSDGGSTYTLVRKAGGLESWLRVGLADYDSPLIELIEISGAAATITLKAPAATPETIGPQDDFPYFAVPAGARISGTSTYGEPLDVKIPGSNGEPQLVGTGYLIKSYTPPPSLSRFEFEKTYREALAKAGWQVAPLAPGTAMGEGGIVAHYLKDGRNIWLVAGRGADDSNIGLTVKVADLGAEDWGRKLDEDCRLPLYGINFDFAQATLRPDSFPLLEKARDLLKKRQEIAVEVAGHTDGVGQDGDNLKLSLARAQAVAAWLAQNGVAAARLEAKGYGETQPVADNNSDAGRAVNRRVELVKKGCRN